MNSSTIAILLLLIGVTFMVADATAAIREKRQWSWGTQGYGNQGWGNQGWGGNSGYGGYGGYGNQGQWWG